MLLVTGTDRTEDSELDDVLLLDWLIPEEIVALPDCVLTGELWLLTLELLSMLVALTDRVLLNDNTVMGVLLVDKLPVDKVLGSEIVDMLLDKLDALELAREEPDELGVGNTEILEGEKLPVELITDAVVEMLLELCKLGRGPQPTQPRSPYT